MIKNILAILVNFGSTILFVLLEIVCLYMIVNNNKEQALIWTNSSNIFVGALYKRYDKFTSYLQLRLENEKLAAENASLRASLLSKNFKVNKQDSLLASNFEFIPAIIINNSVTKLNNKITLNKGTDHGVQKGMGVISSEGIIGVVVNASSKYSTVISVLNIRTKVSGLVKRTNSLGDIVWKGKNPAYVQMNSIPQYVPLIVGDSVITSGFSTVFPKGQMIGIIEKIDQNSRTGYYDVDVKLSTDLGSLSQVYIVKNIIFEKVKEFEKDTVDE